MSKWICVVFVMLALAVPNSVFSENAVRPELGMRLVVSPGYRDTLDESYPDTEISGGYGWVGVHLGMRCRPAEQVVITPRIGFLFNYVMSVGGGDSFANTIVQPALSGKLLFTKGSSMYVEGEVSHNTINTGSDAFDVKGGVGYAAFLGFQAESGFDIGVGYSVVSAEVTNRRGVEDKNFGGVVIRLSGAF